MANIDKLVCRWDGFVGGPGYTIFYATPGAGVRAHILTFWDAIREWLPSIVTISVPNGGDTLDDATGTLTGSWSSGVASTHLGQGTGNFPAPAGAAVTWDTDGIANGRRVRGRTFLVPCSGQAFAADGTLYEPFLTDLRLAAGALVDSAAGALLVWHRPVAGAGGSSHAVVDARVSDKAAVLRSRRD